MAPTPAFAVDAGVAPFEIAAKAKDSDKKAKDDDKKLTGKSIVPA